jgi:D-aminoacyl-tRNA deacylase
MMPMKLVIQFVKQASVSVENHLVGSIEQGYVVFVGINTEDTHITLKKMSEKLLKVRIIPDELGKLNRSILDIKGNILLISQFTLYADTAKGNRPGYIQAAPGKISKPLFEEFITLIKKSGLVVQSGIFGANMEVSLTNSGPITIILEN